MKEVFRNADSALVGLYQSILEDAEISTFVYNTGTQQSIVGGIGTALFPLPQFFPTLSVLNDADYEEAMTILNKIRDAASQDQSDRKCAGCGETVPSNFTSCWNCGAEQSAPE